ncbi:MAG: heavy metal translocating P-type ATPase [Campylobacterales bacterium]|nr:heavy metal translocating P-type ATPase [Campylobacterales bacterium]
MSIRCDHCSLEYPEDVMIKDDGKNFCCKGCQGVYHLLQEEDLNSFYNKKGDEKLDPVKQYDDDIRRFDLDGFTDKYVTKKDGLNEVSLILEGIHCAACVWLNEKVLDKQDGIIDVYINFTTHKAKIKWDDSQIKLSQIITLIRSIGYNGYPYDAKINEERAYKERKEYYTKMIIAIFASMNVMWLAIARYLGYFSGIDEQMKFNIHLAELFLSTPTLFYSGLVFFKGAYFGLRNKIVNMDLLVASGATTVYLFSLWALFTGNGEAYFDSVTMIITFILIGKFLEVKSKKNAIDTLDTLTATLPVQVTVIENGEKRVKAIEDVKEGEILEIKAGERVVFDCEVLSGETSIDVSSLTGESIPEVVSVNDKILGGSSNIDGFITAKVLKDYKASTLYSIISLLEDALSKKPKIEEKANELSEHFSIVILSLAFGTFLGWLYFGDSVETAVVVSVSVIIIACPCALALATPIATVIGIGTAAKKGILFKGANYIETMAKADVLVLDKTGTITKGKPVVKEEEKFGDYSKEILASILKKTNHPIAKGVDSYLATASNLDVSLKEIKARGVEGVIDNEIFYGGNIDFITSKGIFFDKDLKSEYSHFVFANEKEILAIFYLSDEIKEGAKEAIEFIKSKGVEVVIATGDRDKIAKSVGEEVGIEKIHSKLLPNEKADLIDRYKKDGKVVVMTGDGINDTIALAKSDIAIAMHSGADTSIDVSDVVLLQSSLENLRDAFIVSKRTYSFVKQNLLISLVYNALTVPVAIAGYVIPLVAALSMSFSSLLVVGNSLRIKNESPLKK